MGDFNEKRNACLDEVREYIMTVEPDDKSAEKLRDEVYAILREYDIVP